jgi:hypothetical protein
MQPVDKMKFGHVLIVLAISSIFVQQYGLLALTELYGLITAAAAVVVVALAHSRPPTTPSLCRAQTSKGTATPLHFRNRHLVPIPFN